jgi:hypothetical protein
MRFWQTADSGKRQDMRAGYELISAIVARSAIASAARRNELERELRCHIEDAAEEARGAGYDEAEVERIVLRRFGDPGEVARQLAGAYRNEGIAIRSANLAALAILSLFAVAAVIFGAQAALAMLGGIPVAKAFPRLRSELYGFMFLTLGYLVTWRGEHWFRRLRLLKTAFTSCVFLAAAGAALYMFAPGHEAAPVAVFAGAAAFRLLRHMRIRLVGFAGVILPLLIAWALAGPLVPGNGKIVNWQAAVVVCLDTAVCCRLLEALVGAFERRRESSMAR